MVCLVVNILFQYPTTICYMPSDAVIDHILRTLVVEEDMIAGSSSSSSGYSTTFEDQEGVY